MALLLAFPILGLLLIIQSVIISRITLLHGTADLILLTVIAWALHKQVKTAWHWGVIGGALVSIVTALPLGVPFLTYVGAVGVVLFLKRRVWQAPILAMLIATFIATLLSHLISISALLIIGSPISLWVAINNITLPALILNLLLSIPTYAIFNELGNLLYPEALEV